MVKYQIPGRIGRFLDRAADLIFLRKAGGGYIFTHRLMWEHFAAMDVETEEKAEA